MKIGQLCFVGVTFLLSACATHTSVQKETMEMPSAVQISKVTPVILADDLGPVVEFWDRIGLKPVALVPDESGVPFFAHFAGEGFEIMYQSRSSALEQNGDAVRNMKASMVFLEVSNLDEVIERLEGEPVVVEDHQTSYGSREIYYEDPSGNVIGFAQQGIADPGT